MRSETTEQRIDRINRRADREGWGLYDANGRIEIQRDDGRALFADDEAAWAHVTERASKGSPLHREAMEIALDDAQDEASELDL